MRELSFYACASRPIGPGVTEAAAFDASLFKVIEETCELAGAHSRLAGTSRRQGSVAEVEAELADVYLSAAVYAVQVGVPDAFTARHLFAAREPGPGGGLTTGQALSRLAIAVGELTGLHQRGARARRSDLVSAVASVLAGTLAYAAAAGIDLDAAVEAKTAVILSRGWREEDTGQRSDRCGTVALAAVGEPAPAALGASAGEAPDRAGKLRSEP